MSVKKAVAKKPAPSKAKTSKGTVKKAVAKKTIPLRSKDGKNLAGSVSLAGKTAPTAKKKVAVSKTPGRMTESRWIKAYKPMVNHLNPNSGWGFENNDGRGSLFETYGPELKYVQSMIDKNRVWTLVDGDNYREVVVAGYAFVNRIGYFITEEPWDNLDQYWNVPRV